MPEAVIDASPVIFFDHLDLSLKLSVFFDTIYVPTAIEEEVNRKHRFRYRLKALYKSGLFRKCRTSNVTNRRLLELQENIHLGEADAITQAQEQDIRFFIGDEVAARRVARNMGIRPLGTALILWKLDFQDLSDDPRRLVRRLRRDRNCRITDKVVEEARRSASEPLSLGW